MSAALAAAIDAIQRDRLPQWAASVLERGDDHDVASVDLAAAAAVACAAIGDATHREHDRIVARLADAGVVVPAPDAPEPAQRRNIVVPIDPDQLDDVVAALGDLGYRRQETWSPGGERSMRATAHEVVLARDDDQTTTVRPRWHPPRPRSRLDRLFRPTPGDWKTIGLPAWAWWAYSFVRPVRLVLERLGVRSGDHTDVQPFLVTPSSLIDPLLDVAEVGSDDVVADLGSGDGRLVIEAAARRGCRAVGVERSTELAERAVRAVEQRSLSDRVRIVAGDARDVDLSGVTCVLLFLPLVVAREIVPWLLTELPSGARIVLHEQSRLPSDLPQPTWSRPIVAEDAVTVAHGWNVR